MASKVTVSFDRWIVEPLNNFLSSRVGLTLAIVIPILVIPMSHNVQVLENILSSNWTQLWALFVLGIMQARTQEQAKTHHEALKKHVEKHGKVR